MEDAQGNVWAASDDGLYRLTQSKALVVPFPDGVDQNVSTLVPDGDAFYIGTSNALLRWSRDQGVQLLTSSKTQPLLIPGGVRDGRLLQGKLWLLLGSHSLAYWQGGQLHKDNRINSKEGWKVLAAGERLLYLLSEGQLLVFDPASGSQVTIPWRKAQYGASKALYVDSQQQLWITSEKGLFRLAHQGLGWGIESQLLGHYFREMAEDDKGGFYITGRYGIQYYRPADNSLIDYTDTIQSKTQIEGLIPIMVDRNGLVWGGALGEGVLALVPKATPPLVAYSRHSNPALSSDTVWGILKQDNGLLWLTTDAGLEKVDGDKHQLFRPADFNLNDGFYAVQPFQGKLATCGWSGLYLFDPNTETFSHPLTGTPWVGRACMGMWKDGEALMVGGTDGMVRLEGDKIQGWLKDNKDRALGSVKVFARQGQRLWAAGGAGLLRFQDDAWVSQPQLPGIKINAIHALDDQHLLVGFDKEGLWQLDLSGPKPRWENLSQRWGLPSQSVFFIRSQGNKLYVGMQSTLIRVVLGDKPQVDAYFDEDGLPDDELNEGAAQMMPDGTLWVGTAKGVAAFGWGQLHHRVVSEGGGVVYVQARLADGSSLLYWDPDKLPQLPADVGVISIQPGSQNYASERLPRFRYQLSGDSEAVPLLSEAPIVLGNLGHGRHQIKLWYSQGGRWRDQPQQLVIDIATPWYRSYLFFSALGLALLLLTLFVAQLRRSQQQRLRLAYKRASESEQQLRLAIFGANANSWDWHADTDRFTISRPESELAREDGTVDVNLAEVPLHPDDRERVYKVWMEHLEGRAARYDVEYRIMIGSQARWMHVIGRAVERDETGRALRISGIYQDITERKQLEGEVTLYARAFENTAEGVLILNAQKAILSGNPAVERISGFEREELQDKPLAFLLPEEFLDVDVWQQVEQNGAWTGETSLRRKDGSNCALWLNISVMDDPASASRHLVAVFSDMTERKAAEFELRRLANYDVLTGLPNRGMFMQRLSQALATAKSQEQRLALLFMDLDRFKTVNDTYGHRVGDGLLIEAANRLQQVVGERDTLARLGGDEFVVIVHEVDKPEQLIPLCEALLAALARPFNIYGREFFLSTSIGISLFPDDGKQPEALLRNADMAMYHAKDEGRNNMQFYCHERNQEAMRLIQLESDLRQALERDEFFVVYQPQVDVLEGEIVVAVEALVRWRHPTEGLISPDIFIKVAENTGLVAAVDDLVLRRAAQDIKAINTGRTKPMTLSVNISAAHFRQHDFVAQVREVLTGTGLRPSLLCLEITESTLMREVGTAREHLAALRELGVAVAVDDFGTGYSSLAYLKQFAVNELKVDKSFVHDLTGSEADAAIVRSVVDLARNLGLKVVAEGVETEEQLDLCLALGCYRVQGFYYAKPMELAPFQAWLLDWQQRQAG
ncbi:EAL domain-containing protein [Gallaecimonas kandeliae]|nr:EAL domain-containing protein [Gallaecimonas kandeliae]WKE66118.1 EAL domain-containing protein [Gallaecimonas kandeliae]